MTTLTLILPLTHQCQTRPGCLLISSSTYWLTDWLCCLCEASRSPHIVHLPNIHSTLPSTGYPMATCCPPWLPSPGRFVEHCQECYQVSFETYCTTLSLLPIEFWPAYSFLAAPFWQITVILISGLFAPSEFWEQTNFHILSLVSCFHQFSPSFGGLRFGHFIFSSLYFHPFTFLSICSHLLGF